MIQQFQHMTYREGMEFWLIGMAVIFFPIVCAVLLVGFLTYPLWGWIGREND